MSLKNFLLTFLTTTALLFAFTPKSHASHAMGADIFYECVGQDSFRITINFYRDCDGITAPTTASIGITNTCTGTTTTVTAPRTTLIQPEGIPNGSEVSALCNAQIQNSTCNGGSLPGVEQYQYSFLWVANAQCNAWRIAFDLNARNAIIQTLQNPGAVDLYVEAFINNTTLPNGDRICNNSPRFTNRPVPYFCFLDSILYNQGTVDVDGDSLVYTLIQPLQGPGQTIPYAAGFTINNPLTTNNTFNFNSNTGQMFFVPQQAQVGVIAVRVDEYRNGVLIGSTMRDIQVVVLGPPLCNPPYGVINEDGIDSASVSGGVFTGPYEIEACPGDTIRFSIRLGGQNITLSSNATQAFPGATFTTTNIGTDSVVGQFNWITTAADTGLKNFSISYGINSCPIDRTAFQTISINVLDGTDAGPDQVYCSEGAPIQLFATGGNIFNWTPIAGLNDPAIRNPLATPTVTTDFIVLSDLSARCKNRDTVRVTVVPNFLVNILPVDDTLSICRNSLAFLDVVTDSTFGPYTYSWSPGVGLTDSTIRNPVSSPILPTTYFVSVTSDTGCVLTDTVRVNVIGVGPQVTVTPESALVCPGTTVQLNSSVLVVTCGPSISTGSCGAGNLPTPRTYGTSTTTSSVTPFSGGSSDGKYQVLYRAADLTAAGFTAGTITRMQLNVGAKASNAVFKSMRIRMGCTTATQLTRANWIPTTTEVYSSANFLTNSGLNTFAFSQFYDWDGVSNLVIEFCYGDATSTNAGGNDLLLARNVTYAASMSAVSTSSNDGCSLLASAIPTNQPVTQVPNITLFVCSANNPTYTYQWSPATGVSNTSIANPTVAPTVPTIYTLTVSDSICNGQDFATINIDTSFVNVTPDTSLCNADSIPLFVDITGVITNPCGNNGNGCDGNLDTTVVGTGNLSNTSTGYPAPYGNNYESVRQQYLYRASDLLAAGVTPGRLTGLGFNILNRLGSPNYRNFSIKIKCTGTAALTQGVPEGGTFVEVFNPKNISLPANGWTFHDFDNDFDWDGTTNLLIEVCFNNDTDPTQTTNITANSLITSTNAGYVASTWYPIDNQDACSGAIGLPNTLGASNNRPNIRLYTCDAAPPFTVSWNPANTLTDASSRNPVAFPSVTTTYTATVTTNNGCVKTGSVTITVGTLPYTTTPDTTICNGGSAQLRVFGSNGYTYNWTTGTQSLSCTTCANPVATPDTTTTYYVSISDGNCTLTDSIVVTVFNLDGNVILDPGSLCVFDSTLLLAVGGYDGYLWSNNDTTATTWIFAAGTYTLTITDASGCTAVDTIDINVAAEPYVNLGNDTSICVGDSVVLSVSSNYTTYTWNILTQVDTGYTVLTTGSYEVTVVDANGCVSNDSISVFVNTVPVVNLGNDTAICENEPLILSVSLQPGYSYVWQDGTTGPVYSVDSTGTYYVTVSGGLNCFASDTINVVVNPAPDVDLGPDVQSCVGQVEILRAGQGFATYLWNTNSTIDSLVVTQTGVYSVTVADAIGCRDIDSIEVTFFNPIVTLNDTTLCEGSTVTLDAGQFAEYSWNNGDTTRTITVDTSGTYTVTVTNTFGCTATGSSDVTIVPAPTPSITASADTICPGGSPAILDAGAGYSSYNWSTSAVSQTISVAAEGTFTVTVTNTLGCSATASYVIYNFASAALTLDDLVLCPGDTLSYSTSSTYISYQWSNGSTTANTTFTETGVYYLTVTNAQGCVATDSLIVSDGGFTASAFVDPTQVDAGESAALSVDVLGGTGNYSYNWSPSTYLDGITLANPVSTPDSTLTYLVLVTDDSTGCTASDIVTITVFDGARFAFTDAFSPNGDGANDTYFPLTYGNAAVTTFRIYNRWGELVFDELTPWNGQLDGVNQPMGTYVYYAVIEITAADGVTTETVQGSFTLLR
jgi:gliding motility-associated-like protein